MTLWGNGNIIYVKTKKEERHMSITIIKQKVEEAEKILINNNNAHWGYTEYEKEVYSQVSYDDLGFNVKFTIKEKNPLREKINHFESVHEDSCVEFFANFDPENSDRYINFETNANGVMNVSFRANRYDATPLKLEEVEGFGIKADIFDDYWTVSYKIEFSFLKKYYPNFDIDKAEYISCNFYKCGEKTEIEHYMSYFEVKTEKPDFHRPEYFGRIYLK